MLAALGNLSSTALSEAPIMTDAVLWQYQVEEFENAAERRAEKLTYVNVLRGENNPASVMKAICKSISDKMKEQIANVGELFLLREGPDDDPASERCLTSDAEANKAAAQTLQSSAGIMMAAHEGLGASVLGKRSLDILPSSSNSAALARIDSMIKNSSSTSGSSTAAPAEVPPEEQIEGDVIEIDRGEEKLGIDLDWNSGTDLAVAQVQPGGAVDNYNKDHMDERLLVGDRIMSINGVSGAVYPMLQRLKKDRVLRMIVKKRPRIARV